MDLFSGEFFNDDPDYMASLCKSVEENDNFRFDIDPIANAFEVLYGIDAEFEFIFPPNSASMAKCVSAMVEKWRKNKAVQKYLIPLTVFIWKNATVWLLFNGSAHVTRLGRMWFEDISDTVRVITDSAIGFWKSNVLPIQDYLQKNIITEDSDFYRKISQSAEKAKKDEIERRRSWETIFSDLESAKRKNVQKWLKNGKFDDVVDDRFTGENDDKKGSA